MQDRLHLILLLLLLIALGLVVAWIFITWWQRSSRPPPLPPINRYTDAAEGDRFGRIFISYSYADGATIARQLVSELEASGAACWMGQRDLKAGQDFPPQIVRAIRECRAMVVLITSGANGSRDVLQEVSLGHNARKPILPLIVHGALPSDGLAYYLGIVQQIVWSDARTAAATVRAVIPRAVS